MLGGPLHQEREREITCGGDLFRDEVLSDVCLTLYRSEMRAKGVHFLDGSAEAVAQSVVQLVPFLYELMDECPRDRDIRKSVWRKCLQTTCDNIVALLVSYQCAG